MPKATSLTPDVLTPQTTAPLAATLPRGPQGLSTPKVEMLPLQIRLPRHEVKAIKVAAAQSEQTISDFILACFHAYMETQKHA